MTTLLVPADIWSDLRIESQGRLGWRIVSGLGWWFVDIDCVYMFSVGNSGLFVVHALLCSLGVVVCYLHLTGVEDDVV
jgi:hypothetical protein